MASSAGCGATAALPANGVNAVSDMTDGEAVIPQDSIADYEVLAGSPIVGFLSEAGDAFDNLAVKIQSISMTSGISPVQSLSLRADIEKLTTENNQLRKDALENRQAMKTHFERCNMWREQMQKVHEQDATMIEEARQTTLKLQQEIETLHACLQSNQKKLEESIVEKFNLSEAKKTLEIEIAKLRSELTECQQKLEDMSFEEISMLEGKQGSGGSVLPSSKETSDELKEGEQVSRKESEATSEQKPEENPLVVSLQTELDRLKEEIEGERQSHAEAMTRIEELEAVLGKQESEIAELHEQLKAAKEEREVYGQKMEIEYKDLLKQASLDKASFDTERERKIQELNERLALFEKAALQGQQHASALEKAKRDILEAATKHQFELSQLNQKLSEDKNEIEKLKAEGQRLREERDALEEACEQVNACANELKMLKEREAAFKLLQSDQASQLEAFKEEWRQEQTARLKWEKNYNDLLQTWQNFEQNQPVMVGGEAPRESQAIQEALDRANAERTRLEGVVTSLNQEIADLQAQNVQLMNDRLVNTPQQATGQRSTFELRCPLCDRTFTEQTTLIQHAGMCDGIEER